MSIEQGRKSGRPTDPGKREAIIAAASRSFFDHGYAASSIEQIAADAGVSKVTIYNQFGDKASLFTQAVEHECEKMRGVFSLEAAAQGNLRERLTTIGEAMMAFLSRPEMMKFERRIAAETERAPEIGLAFLNAGPRRMKAAFAALLASMAKSGELRIEDPPLAAEQFVSMCKGLGDVERRFGAPADPERDAQRIAGAVDVFLTAYRAVDGQRK